VLYLKAFQLILLSALSGDYVSRGMTPQNMNVLASICAAVSMSIFLIMSLLATAYVDHVKDRMEHISKAVLVLTPILATLASVVQFEGSDQLFGVVLNISTTLGWGGMCLMWVMSLACCKTKMKTRSGRLAFSDPNGISEWESNETLPPWNLDVERKRRLWKPFWNRVMEEDDELSGRSKTSFSSPQVAPEVGSEQKEDENKKKKKKKKNRRLSMIAAPDGSGVQIPYATQRWEETLQTLRLRGFNAFESSLLPLSPSDMHTRLWLQAICEGEWQECGGW